MSTPKSFVAYPSSLPGRGDAIEAAVDLLNSGGIVNVTSWTSLLISGRPIIETICERIRESDILIADITNLNPNVLFELGYGLTQRKRLWLIFNPSVKGANVLFDRFQLLTTIGHTPYQDSGQIVDRFYRDEPYKHLDEALFDSLIQSSSTTTREDSLLYIKPEVSTEAVKRITRRVSGGKLPSVIDDPNEIGVQPLQWYIANVRSARAVICHFLSDDYEDVRISNAKNAFVAGLAFGLDKPLLMLAHSPYQSPIDYRDLLRVHNDAKQAEAFYQSWLTQILESAEDDPERQRSRKKTPTSHGGLLELKIGDPIAEYEPEELLEYFVPTSAYVEALNSQHSIFVGRKGVGKTATLLKVADQLRSDPRNHICIVKPVDYELEGLVAILQKQMTTSERGFLVESFWKSLIYTELAKSLYETIMDKLSFVSRTKTEDALVAFVEANQSLILPEFSMRLEALVAILGQLDLGNQGPGDRKTKISEGAHKFLITGARDVITAVLEKSNMVALLVDNLDKNWTARTDIQTTSELLIGLLSVSQRIGEEFRKTSLGKRRINVMMTIFIRSDIYAAILPYSREPDKLPVRKIEWNDQELLVRVVEKRFMTADSDLQEPSQVWDKYFAKEVEGLPTKETLVSSVFPRPRDLIYLVRASLQHAVNRGHRRIEEKDIASGREQYSSFVFASLMAEGAPQFRQLQDFMVHLFGGPSILTEDDIREALEATGIGIVNAPYLLDLLQELNFLSYETSPGHFAFAYEKEQKPKLTSLAAKTAKLVGKKRFEIHPAFHSYLELKPIDHAGQQPLAFKTAAQIR